MLRNLKLRELVNWADVRLYWFFTYGVVLNRGIEKENNEENN